MKKLTFFLAIMLSANCFGQMKTTIEDIVENPDKYLEEEVEFEGVVGQFTKDPSESMSHYLIEGKYGKTIKVKTSQGEPDQKQKYLIKGIVYFESDGSLRPYVHEERRTISGNVPPPTPTPTPSTKPSILMYVIIGAAILLIVILVIFFVNSRKSRVDNVVSEVVSDPATQKLTPVTDFKTIKLNVADPKTVKVKPGITGRFEIIAGADKGRSFILRGFPTDLGNVVTIGRKVAAGPRAYAHLQLHDDTVSGEQAEIREKGKHLFLKNLSNTNKTQLDGVTLEVGEEVEIRSGQVIRMGEIDIRYIYEALNK